MVLVGNSFFGDVKDTFFTIQFYRRPIEERVVTAMGKHWHIEHFACAKCEKPFLGHKHYEKNGQAYCYFHYHQLFGSLCYHCNGVIEVKAYFLELYYYW